MLEQSFKQVESIFLKALNQMTEPLIRAGLGSPVCWPASAIVLETIGRKTGRTHKVPLIAVRFDSFLLVSTVRPHSQWLKNLAKEPRIHYWLGGRRRQASAFVIGPGFESQSTKSLPPLVSCLLGALTPQSQLLGIGYAILAPRQIQTRGV